jgi:hypothetical protein
MEIIILLGFLCLVPVGLGIALLVIYLNRAKADSSGDSLEGEVHGLRTLVKMQQEDIATLKSQVKELTEKLQSRGSTDITT